VQGQSVATSTLESFASAIETRVNEPSPVAANDSEETTLPTGVPSHDECLSPHTDAMVEGEESHAPTETPMQDYGPRAPTETPSQGDEPAPHPPTGVPQRFSSDGDSVVATRAADEPIAPEGPPDEVGARPSHPADEVAVSDPAPTMPRGSAPAVKPKPLAKPAPPVAPKTKGPPPPVSRRPSSAERKREPNEPVPAAAEAVAVAVAPPVKLHKPTLREKPAVSAKPLILPAASGNSSAVASTTSAVGSAAADAVRAPDPDAGTSVEARTGSDDALRDGEDDDDDDDDDDDAGESAPEHLDMCAEAVGVTARGQEVRVVRRASGPSVIVAFT